jgi:glycosyltransferase involved in cell wall biosynthesis
MTLVSLVVTTKNEEANIARCLTSVKRQTHREIELIVVDNASSDRTKVIAKSFTPHVFDLGPERSAQRNFGIMRSRGSIVLYLDADMILSPCVVAECVSLFDKHPETVALYIPEKIIGKGFWIKVRDHERSFYNGTVVDAVRAFRREAFDLISGFDENLCGVEDWDFDLRMRGVGRTQMTQAPLFHNEEGFRLQNYLGKKSYYAQSFAEYRQKWGLNNPEIKKQFSPTYRYWGVFTEKWKFLNLLRHPLLTIAMFALRFLVGLRYLKAMRHEQVRPLNGGPSYQAKDTSKNSA